ncbi:MAG: nuclease family protein [Gammaproteobacteria bacterium]|jgi:putative endonuclease|nr:nuclease family protein [Gammaproteobacteria bacterium]
MKEPAVYIVASQKNGTLYTRVTSDIVQRIYQHKEGLVKGFTAKYNCKDLVYYELHENMPSAIEREKQMKGGSRKSKIQLIESVNPTWRDLYKDVLF